MASSFTKEQREVAKKKNIPLVALLIDDRHVVSADGKKRGSYFAFQGPASPEHTELVNSLLCKIIKER